VFISKERPPGFQAGRWLEAFDAGALPPAARAFRYRRAPALLEVLIWGAILVPILVPTLVPIFGGAAVGGSVRASVVGFFRSSNAAVDVIAIGLGALLGWRLVDRSLELLHAASNVLIVAPGGVVRRRRGKVASWPFSEFTDVTVVIQSRQSTSFPIRGGGAGMNAAPATIYLNRSGNTFEDELVDDGSFGERSEILNALIRQANSGDRPHHPAVDPQGRPGDGRRLLAADEGDERGHLGGGGKPPQEG
jgi:Arc/MetJ-type ribon-helix-helix transcriptional regulator